MCEPLHTSLVVQKMQGGQKPCANWQLVWVWAPQTIKIAYCFDVVSNTLRSEARLNSVSVGGPWPGVVLIHHMPGWDEWIKVRKEKASQRRTAGVAGRAALGVTYRWKAAAP